MALLRQTFVHCARFPTAASRRSLGRISVPMWPDTLSGRLPIVALVGRYPANKLMGRELILKRPKPFVWERCLPHTLCGISHPLGWLSPTLRQIVHALLTRSPLVLLRARLACMKHAISVRSEPGSNSPYDPYAFISVRNSSLFPEIKLPSKSFHSLGWLGYTPSTEVNEVRPLSRLPSVKPFGNT